MEKISSNAIAQVIIVAGFLGAGKTTLIESILKTPELHKRVAVIQNEFSPQMGLESSLMKDSNGEEIEDFYEMPNGCLCCAAKDDLIQTLDSMLEKNERAGRQNLDYIIVETNGLADPCQLIQTFWLDDQLMSKVQFHSCICLIDCTNFQNKIENESQISDFPENQLLIRQLVFADKILLNKCDISSKEQISIVNDAIRKTNAHAIVLQTSYSKITLETLITKPQLQLTGITDHSNSAHQFAHQILAQIQSIYIEGYGTLKKESIEVLIGKYLWETDNILRCKGMFNTKNESLMLQGVGTLFEFRPINKNDLKYVFLFVGRNLNKNLIESEIKTCLI